MQNMKTISVSSFVATETPVLLVCMSCPQTTQSDSELMFAVTTWILNTAYLLYRLNQSTKG